MTAEQAQTLIDAAIMIKGAIDFYGMVFAINGGMILSGLIWRLILLSKNQRNIW